MHSARYGFAAPRRFDQVNLKHAATILGIFGIITIISYFNELAKQGLLTGNSVHYKSLQQQTAQIKRGTDQIDLDLAQLKSVIRRNVSRKASNIHDRGNINIALHLDRNTSYESSGDSAIKLLIYRNVMPNFFHSIDKWDKNRLSAVNRLKDEIKELQRYCDANETTSRIDIDIPSAVKQKHCKQELELLREKEASFANGYQKMMKSSELKEKRQKYSNAVQVFVYQHESAAYNLRDCFKKLASNRSLFNSPFNQNVRQKWLSMSDSEQTKFDALYGSLAFGVCETINKPCLYSVMLAHPLDRILQVYLQCRQDNRSSLCNFYRSSNSTQGHLYGFIKMMSNSFFKKLIFYSKQCRLIGDDEICIKDNKASFILRRKERQTYLAHILANLDNWFGVIGLVDHWNESLTLFEEVTGFHFTSCPSLSQPLVPRKFKKLVKLNDNKVESIHEDLVQLKKELLNDSQVVQWLHADLAIYDSMKSIFEKQWKVYLDLKEARHKRVSEKTNKLKVFNKSAVLTSKKTDISSIPVKKAYVIQKGSSFKAKLSTPHHWFMQTATSYDHNFMFKRLNSKA